MCKLLNYLPFSFKRIKIGKVEKFLANLHNKNEYFIHTKNLNQALNRELLLKKVHRIIKFNQKVWITLHIDMNTELRKKSKN